MHCRSKTCFCKKKPPQSETCIAIFRQLRMYAQEFLCNVRVEVQEEPSQESTA